MDTERFFKYSEEKLKDVSVWLEGTSDELVDLIDFVELTRHIQEINQWFEIFIYSLSELKRVYLSAPSLVPINTYLISLLGSGKCLVDSIETCIKQVFRKSESEIEHFRNEVLSKEYDKCFSYKFLYKLRNFSQHGHIPVSTINGTIHFDINQIYHTPHYSFNKQLKKEIDDFVEYINKQRDICEGPFLDFPYTVCAYTCSIFRIYKEFLGKIKGNVDIYWRDLKSELEKEPILFTHENEALKGMVFYNIVDRDDNVLHGFNILEDPNQMVRNYYNRIVNVLKAETDILKKLKKNSIKI